MILFDLKVDGPTVFQAPPGLMGPVDDANFLFLFDIGPTGKDKGKGGKYLILPPDYKGDVPDGYFVFRSPTYRHFSFVRANAEVVGTGEKAMEFFRKNCAVYPLKTGPRKGTFTNVTGVPINTLVPEDATAFAWMHDLINYEPAEAFGKEKLGRLASIGIVKGKPFNPDARMKKILEQAAKEGVAMSRVIALDSRQPAARVYPNRMWESPFIGDSSSFDPDGYFNLEARTTFHFTADGITPSMAAQMPDGLGSRYQTTYKDKDGNYLDGNKTYKLHMPPECPGQALLGGDGLRSLDPLRDPEPALSEHQQPAEAAADHQYRWLHRHLLLQREAGRCLRPRTGSRPCPTRASSSTCATTVLSRSSMRRRGCRMMLNWWTRNERFRCQEMH